MSRVIKGLSRDTTGLTLGHVSSPKVTDQCISPRKNWGYGPYGPTGLSVYAVHSVIMTDT